MEPEVDPGSSKVDWTSEGEDEVRDVIVVIQVLFNCAISLGSRLRLRDQ